MREPRREFLENIRPLTSIEKAPDSRDLRVAAVRANPLVGDSPRNCHEPRHPFDLWLPRVVPDQHELITRRR
jgi:hypothetical protein